jgi:RNA polymerase sigma factor for flagellar operon FliA
LPLYEGIPLSRVTLVKFPALAANGIGFDSESKPTLLKGDVATGPHLVQLAIDTRA